LEPHQQVQEGLLADVVDVGRLDAAARAPRGTELEADDAANERLGIGGDERFEQRQRAVRVELRVPRRENDVRFGHRLLSGPPNGGHDTTWRVHPGWPRAAESASAPRLYWITCCDACGVFLTACPSASSGERTGKREGEQLC